MTSGPEDIFPLQKTSEEWVRVRGLSKPGSERRFCTAHVNTVVKQVALIERVDLKLRNHSWAINVVEVSISIKSL